MENKVKNVNVKEKKNLFSIIEKKIDKLRRKRSSKVATTIVEYYDFYKTEVYKKHLVIYVISLILFLLTLIYLFSIVNSTNEISEFLNQVNRNNILNGKIANFKDIFTNKVLLNFILLLSGVTPYIYIPVIGIVYSSNLALNIVTLFNNIASNMNPTFMTIGSIVQIIGFSLTIAVGIYFCKISTKRFRYSQSANFTFNDIKKEYYQIKNNEEKLKKAIEAEEKRNEKLQKLNVKIPYKMLLITFILSSIFVIIGGLISLI